MTYYTLKYSCSSQNEANHQIKFSQNEADHKINISQNEADHQILPEKLIKSNSNKSLEEEFISTFVEKYGLMN